MGEQNSLRRGRRQTINKFKTACLTLLIGIAGLMAIPVMAAEPDYVFIVPPRVIYPDESRMAGEEGDVVVKVFIEKTGFVHSVEIIKSSGYPRLDQAAIETYQKVQFAPVIEDGEPLAVATEGTIRFRKTRPRPSGIGIPTL